MCHNTVFGACGFKQQALETKTKQCIYDESSVPVNSSTAPCFLGQVYMADVLTTIEVL